MYIQSQNYLTYNQNMPATQFSEYPSTCEFSSNHIQNVPNYFPVVENTSAEHEPEKKSAKRKRVMYTDSQREELEQEFEKNVYIGLERRAEMAEALNLSQHQVKVWFQNKRQKVKKDMIQTKVEGAVNNSNNLPHSNTATTPILQSQHLSNVNDNYGNHSHFHSHQPADPNFNNYFITNSIPLNGNQYNIYNCNNKFVAPMLNYKNQHYNGLNYESTFDSYSDYDYNYSELIDHNNVEF